MILRNSELKDFVQVQLDSLLKNPPAFKSFRRDLQQLGLYSRARGFSYQSDFMRVRTSRRSTKDQYDLLTGRHTTTHPGKRSPQHRKQTSELPELTAKPQQDALKGPLNTAFFRRHRLVVSCATLFALFIKADVIPSPSASHKTKSYVHFSPHRLSKSNVFNLPTKLCDLHILHFLHIAANFQHLPVERLISIPDNVKDCLQTAFRNMDRSDPKRLNKRKVSEQHLASILEQQGPFGELAGTLAKAIFRKNPALNEDSFMGFLGKYILTHDRLCQLRLCFDIYAENEAYITSKMMFRMFKSNLCAILDGDIQPLLQALQSAESEEIRLTPMPRRRPQDLQDSWKETLQLPRQANSLNFRDFTRVFFPQRFPDMLLVIAYILAGQTLVDYLCVYFGLPDFKVDCQGANIKIARWSIQHQVYEERFWEK